MRTSVVISSRVDESWVSVILIGIETTCAFSQMLFYQILAFLLVPMLALRFVIKAYRQRDYLAHFKQRFGYTEVTSVDMWIHAVSVGEARVAAVLLTHLRAAHPSLRFVITTTTPTGKVALSSIVDNETVFHSYCPFDSFGCMRRFFVRTRPRLLLVIETEVWPNMLSVAKHLDCPAVLVNGRLSMRSCARYNLWFLRAFSRLVFNQFALIIAQSHADAQRYKALGFDGQMAVCGNIKFDMMSTPSGKAHRQRQESIAWLALSVRDGEIVHIIEAAQQIGAQVPNSQCVILPRHLHLVAESVQCAERAGLRCVVVQTPQEIMTHAHADMIVINAMGVVASALACVDFVFVGGSLVPKGGQNILEPIAYDKPVCVGTHYFNFQAIVDGLRDKKAIAVVESSSRLAQRIVHWHQHYHQAQAQVANARGFYQTHQGATGRMYSALEPLLNKSLSCPR